MNIEVRRWLENSLLQDGRPRLATANAIELARSQSPAFQFAILMACVERLPILRDGWSDHEVFRMGEQLYAVASKLYDPKLHLKKPTSVIYFATASTDVDMGVTFRPRSTWPFPTWQTMTRRTNSCPPWQYTPTDSRAPVPFRLRLPSGSESQSVSEGYQRKQAFGTTEQRYVWPENQPAPAIAPFDGKEARQHQAEWAAHLGVPVEFENSIGMKFRIIPPGEFLMGINQEEMEKLVEAAKTLETDWLAQSIPNSGPQHHVTLTKPLAMGIHEVTRRAFRQFVDATGFETDAEKDGKGGMGWKEGDLAQALEFRWNTPLGFESEQTEDHPVVNVSWNDGEAFCKWLSEKEGVEYRLPTEAEWEYACRAGDLGPFKLGADDSALQQYAWFARHDGRNTKAVGLKMPNSFGLFDMYGNANEWCRDAHRAYSTERAINPVGVSHDRKRTFRGGSYRIWLPYIHPSYVRASSKAFCCDELGFRVVRTFEKYERKTNSPDPDPPPATAPEKKD
jgi:formylglycine-generating enzyme required for sulfatase activity